MNLLITGSRHASHAMLAEVERVIHCEMQPVTILTPDLPQSDS